MSTVAIASLGASPGVSTCAVALALSWSQPVLLVEADVSKPSSVVAGLMQGSLPADAGLMGVAQSSGMHAVSEQDVWDFAVSLNQSEDDEVGRWLLPALSEPAAARGMRSFWSDLLRLLRGMSNQPLDTLIDLGRIENRTGRDDLVTDTDHLLIVVRSDLASVAAAKAHLPEIEQDRASRGASGTISLVVVEDMAQKVSSAEIAKFLGAPVVGRIPHAPVPAARYSGGRPVRARALRGFNRSVAAVEASVHQQIDKRRMMMEGKA